MGKDVFYTLRPEPNNPHDSLAIAVDAHWDSSRVIVGYVPRIYAEEISELLDWERPIRVEIICTFYEKNSFERSIRVKTPQLQLTLLNI